MLRYKKFVAGFDSAVGRSCRSVTFVRPGFRPIPFSTPDIAELSKLLETTYFGVLIGWAQEMERLAAQLRRQPTMMLFRLSRKSIFFPPIFSPESLAGTV